NFGKMINHPVTGLVHCLNLFFQIGNGEMIVAFYTPPVILIFTFIQSDKRFLTKAAFHISVVFLTPVIEVLNKNFASPSGNLFEIVITSRNETSFVFPRK